MNMRDSTPLSELVTQKNHGTSIEIKSSRPLALVLERTQREAGRVSGWRAHVAPRD